MPDQKDSKQNPAPAAQTRTKGAKRLTRRKALKILGGAAWLGAFGYAMAPVRQLAEGMDLQSFLQQHYKELSPEDKKRIFERLEREAQREYGVKVRIEDPPPLPNVKYGYALNLTTCIGCRKCVEACRKENNHNRAMNGSYIRVFEIPNRGLDIAHGRLDYDHPVPVDGYRYFPVQCHHCDNPPCVDVCPTKATWKEPDGIVVIDYNWCIGCRYCAAACPYQARFFNWTKPEIPPEEVNPDQGYLSNRIRSQGVMEKCTFCLHRVRKGLLPACLEACPAGARVFGNLLDPKSEIRWVLENRRVFILKEEQATRPIFYYYLAE
ncbi:MAG: 4Fe-4S dicluster domain-containing protein [Myxococcales bacterium]|nr:MAG: 4Fe-4S dicluster domain-containing protein [Myxococcales bacterium]